MEFKGVNSLITLMQSQGGGGGGEGKVYKCRSHSITARATATPRTRPSLATPINNIS
jgi:hypothetical protein